ncbi:MAG: protein-export chaperone SecB [Pseudomonadota bacterium]
MAQSESAGREVSQLQLRLERIYLKDASFESPSTPAVFTQQWQPNFQLDLNTRTEGIGENRVEVVLMATLKADLPELADGPRTAFIAEVQQAGLFTVEGGDDASRRMALGIACPTMLFPYVRATMDDIVVKGGFPAVQLAPVNFEALYRQAEARAAQEQAGAGGDGQDVTH